VGSRLYRPAHSTSEVETYMHKTPKARSSPPKSVISSSEDWMLLDDKSSVNLIPDCSPASSNDLCIVQLDFQEASVSHIPCITVAREAIIWRSFN